MDNNSFLHCHIGHVPTSLLAVRLGYEMEQMERGELVSTIDVRREMYSRVLSTLHAVSTRMAATFRLNEEEYKKATGALPQKPTIKECNGK